MLIHFKDRDNPFFCDSDMFMGLTEDEQTRLLYERKQCRETVVLIVAIIAAALLVGYSIFKGDFLITLIITVMALFAGVVYFGIRE